MNIIDKILYLIPDAKFSVWDWNGDQTPIFINGKLIDWNPTNVSACPTKEQIDAIDEEAAIEALKTNPRSSFFDPNA